MDLIIAIMGLAFIILTPPALFIAHKFSDKAATDTLLSVAAGILICVELFILVMMFVTWACQTISRYL